MRRGRELLEAVTFGVNVDGVSENGCLEVEEEEGNPLESAFLKEGRLVVVTALNSVVVFVAVVVVEGAGAMGREDAMELEG